MWVLVVVLLIGPEPSVATHTYANYAVCESMRLTLLKLKPELHTICIHQEQGEQGI